MDLGKKATCVLVLGLSCVAVVRGDDDVKPARTGNWFTRLFVRDAADKRKDAPRQEAIVPAPLSPALVRQKALHECMRRQEVCDRLKQIAAQTGDDDLRRKAEILDQRAWDLYLERTGQGKTTLTPDEQVLEEHLGVDASPRLQKPAASAGSAAARFSGRFGPRKD